MSLLKLTNGYLARNGATMRRISISTCFDYTIPLETQFELLSKVGFTHISLGGNYKHSKLLEEHQTDIIRELMKKHQIHIDTIHGCNADDERALETMTKVIDVADDLNVPVVVMHAIAGFEIKTHQIEEKVKNLITICQQLEPIIKYKGVKVALENLFPGNADVVLHTVLPTLNPEYFGFCYDSSHEQVDGPLPLTLLDKYSNNIIAIHLSDRIKPFVDHAIPGEGFIDFESLIQQLKASSYKGPITLELMKKNSFITELNQYLSEAYQKGVEIHDQIYFD